jgi:signal transduction histidine kinase
VDVIDQGEGIAPEDQRKIFDEFVQLGKRKNQEGTGLGLPISQRLAQLLHGSLLVASEVNLGSTFTLRLPAKMEVPVARDQQPRPAPARRDAVTNAAASAIRQ